MNKRRFKKLLVAMVVLFACLGLGAAIYYCISKKNVARYDEVIGSITYVEENRERDFENLFALLENKVGLSHHKIAHIYNRLAQLYTFEQEHEKSITYFQYSLFYAEKAKEYELAAWNYVDVANIFISLRTYEIAEETVKIALDYVDKIKDPEGAERVKEYVYLNLAQINALLGDGEEALKYVDYPYHMMVGMNEDFDLMLGQLRAHGYYYSGDINKAKEEINKVEIGLQKLNMNRDEGFHIENVAIPYYQLKSKIALNEKKYTEALDICEEFFAICRKYEVEREILFHIQDVLNLLGDDIDKLSLQQQELIRSYEEFLLDKYPEFLEARGSESSHFMLNSFLTSLASLKQNDAVVTMQNSIIKAILIVGTIIIFLVYFLSSILMENRIDGLTNVNNRRLFDRVYRRYLKKKHKFHLLLFDIDHFKRVNDTYGHEFGDTVLVGIGEALKKVLSQDEKLFRYGGEEFCIITRKKKLEEVLVIAEQIRSTVENIVWEYDVVTTISIGIAASSEEGSTIKLADERMYDSKQKGRNCITYL